MALNYRKTLAAQDFTLSPIRNFLLENLSADPSGSEGQVFYNSSTHLLKYKDNSAVQIVASKSYVDAQVTAAQNNWDFKEVVRFAVTTNVDISSALVNGASLGGVTAATGDRALLVGQTNQSQNGIYIVAASGAASRSTDADSDAEVTQGLHVEVAEGTLAGAAFLLVTANPITLGTTDLDFLQLTGGGTSYTAGDGLNLSGGEFSVDVGDIAGSGLENDGSNNLRIASAAAGNGLTGGGGSALSVVSDATGGANLAKAVNVSSNGLAVKIDDSTIGENGSARLFVKNGGITETQLASSVAGDGLAGGAGTALSVNVDGSSIEINSDSLRVKAAGITESHLATSVAGAGLAGGGGTALSVNVDDVGIEINSDTLRLKDSGVTAAKIDSAVWGYSLDYNVLETSKVNVKRVKLDFTTSDWTTSGGEDILTFVQGTDFDFGSISGAYNKPMISALYDSTDSDGSTGNWINLADSVYWSMPESSGNLVIRVTEGNKFNGSVFIEPAEVTSD